MICTCNIDILQVSLWNYPSKLKALLEIPNMYCHQGQWQSLLIALPAASSSRWCWPPWIKKKWNAITRGNVFCVFCTWSDLCIVCNEYYFAICLVWDDMPLFSVAYVHFLYKVTKSNTLYWQIFLGYRIFFPLLLPFISLHLLWATINWIPPYLSCDSYALLCIYCSNG